MLDIAYIALTVVFFGLMLAYVRGCERLGSEGKARGRAVMSGETIVAGVVSLLLLVYLVYTLLRPEKF